MGDNLDSGFNKGSPACDSTLLAAKTQTLGVMSPLTPLFLPRPHPVPEENPTSSAHITHIQDLSTSHPLHCCRLVCATTSLAWVVAAALLCPLLPYLIPLYLFTIKLLEQSF